MFINVSNHPTPKWSEEQLRAAKLLGGEVADVQFPNVPPTASALEVKAMAEKLSQDLLDRYGRGNTFIVSGEQCLATLTGCYLTREGNRVVAASTERVSKETTQPDGTVKKETVFSFVQFREVYFY